jgi:hypothetical protein
MGREGRSGRCGQGLTNITRRSWKADSFRAVVHSDLIPPSSPYTKSILHRSRRRNPRSGPESNRCTPHARLQEAFARPADGQTGMLACIGGSPVALDLFDKPETLAKMWTRSCRGTRSTPTELGTRVPTCSGGGFPLGRAGGRPSGSRGGWSRDGRHGDGAGDRRRRTDVERRGAAAVAVTALRPSARGGRIAPPTQRRRVRSSFAVLRADRMRAGSATVAGGVSSPVRFGVNVFVDRRTDVTV